MDKPIEQVNTRPAPVVTQLNETFALGVQRQLNRAERGKAVDIRPQSSALLTINSADRYKPNNNRWNTPDLSGVLLSSPYDFTIPVQQNMMSGFFTRIALTSLQLPFTVPTICGKTNGIYIWWQPGGSGAVTRYFICSSASYKNTHRLFYLHLGCQRNGRNNRKLGQLRQVLFRTLG